MGGEGGGPDRSSLASDEVVLINSLLGWRFSHWENGGKCVIISVCFIARFANLALSHHSADIAGKGDAFTWFILGAAAAAA